jgi:hypothetical protein
VHADVLSRGDEQLGIVLELAEPVVAGEAEQAADATGLVVVVDVQADVGSRRLPADGATPTLRLEHPVVVLRGEPVLLLQVSLPDRLLDPTVLPIGRLLLPDPFGIGLRPLASLSAGSLLRYWVVAITRRSLSPITDLAFAAVPIAHPRGGIEVVEGLLETAEPTDLRSHRPIVL